MLSNRCTQTKSLICWIKIKIKYITFFFLFSQKLNKNDIKFLMNILEETITDEQIEYMMLVADKDGDGFISYKEFLRVIMNEMVDD